LGVSFDQKLLVGSEDRGKEKKGRHFEIKSDVSLNGKQNIGR